jgi:putative tryptophan/tyrosine transport system substrate-binding protein
MIYNWMARSHRIDRLSKEVDLSDHSSTAFAMVFFKGSWGNKVPHLKRRELIGLMGFTAVWPRRARAQTPKKVPTIGVLWHAGSSEEEKFPLAQFRAGLNDIGYVEGQNIVLENRFPAEQPERFDALAADLVRIKVDILFTVTRLAALAAQRATKTIPIVFMSVADPVGSKLIDSLARPGGNITGLANMALELTPKRFELLKEVVGLSRAALLVNATDPAGVRYVELSNQVVGPLGVTIEPVEVRTPNDFERAFSEISKKGLQGVVTTQDGLIYNEQPQMFRLALEHRLPLIGYSREMAVNGALISYGPNNALMFRRAATFVDKILKGTKGPADIPVEQPTKFELVINMKTAEALGLEISPLIISRADELV